MDLNSSQIMLTIINDTFVQRNFIYVASIYAGLLEQKKMFP